MTQTFKRLKNVDSAQVSTNEHINQFMSSKKSWNEKKKKTWWEQGLSWQACAKSLSYLKMG